jgi:glycosyltransferase involved in cell wall biosynthesis
MMQPVSVIIICKNEEKAIAGTIKSVQAITDDIICVDSGSTDNTIEIINRCGARLLQTNWEGYGKTKNKGIAAAKYDWILTLDADEPVDAELQQSILTEKFEDSNTVYNLSFRTFYIGKRIRFGEWGSNEKHLRLFNRSATRWQEVDVHEQLDLPAGIKIKLLKGFVNHHTVDSYEDYMQKTFAYALLNGKKYYQQDRKISLLKLWLAPPFSFLYNYILRLGFLDGWEGFLIARTTAIYTFIKYAHLRELRKDDNRE